MFYECLQLTILYATYHACHELTNFQGAKAEIQFQTLQSLLETYVVSILLVPVSTAACAVALQMSSLTPWQSRTKLLGCRFVWIQLILDIKQMHPGTGGREVSAKSGLILHPLFPLSPSTPMIQKKMPVSLRILEHSSETWNCPGKFRMVGCFSKLHWL